MQVAGTEPSSMVGEGFKVCVRLALASTWLLIGLCLAFQADTASAAAVSTPLAVDPGVPDQGRAWELVTPEEPIPAVLIGFQALADDGQRIAYEAVGVLPGSPYGDGVAPYMATRTETGWVNQQEATPYPRFSSPFLYDHPVLYDQNLDSSLLLNQVPGDANHAGLYLHRADGTFALKTILPRNQIFLEFPSLDLRRSFFQTEEHLVPEDATRTAGASIFELEDTEIRQVDVDSGGNLLFECGAEVPAEHGISTDGLRVFLVPGWACGGQGGVYLRENGTTTEISAAACGLPDCGGEPDARFVGATGDGAHAYLYAETRLTASDSDPGPDLYRYDVGSGQLVLLTEMPGITPTAKLAKPAPDGSAVVFGADSEDEGEGIVILDSHGARFLPTSPAFMEWAADGRYLVFDTNLRLSSQDQDDQVDVYRYDSVTGTFTEISRGDGGAGNGPSAAELELDSSPSIRRFYPGNPYRVTSSDGQRVFFSTAERLVPEDHNEGKDVYEWAAGQVGLISSGAGSGDANYLNSTPDGRTVIFRTGQTLVGRDRDGGELDYYAARIGGGFPEPAEPASGCQGAPCRTASGGPAPLGSAAAGKGILALRHPSATERTRFAASGWLDLLVETPHAGKLRARARAALGRRLRTIGSQAVALSEAGPTRLRLRLSPPARGALRRGKALRVRISLAMGRGDSAHAAFSIARRP